MNERYKKVIINITVVITTIIGINLIINNYTNYGLILLAIAIACTIITIFYKKNIKDPNIKFNYYLKQILKTYDSILIESKKIPSLKNKNIIPIKDLEGLIDAQVELRKPIYYFKQTDTCSFILFDQDQALIHILKEREELISPLEIELKEIQLSNKNNIDEKVLEEIDKTTIVKLPNEKSYKISPIKKTIIEDTIEIL